jgi:2-polyprenyl-3-methyl-5-hydroxy-6-metoxy-1,4-benzoquinol methylase
LHHNQALLEAFGSDLSASLIETATQLTATSGLKNIEYYQADGQGSDAHKGQYDLVIAHTVISHVADPAALLREAIRLARPGGQIIVHDGDYASMTFGTHAPELDHKMPGFVLQAVVANRFVMREVPRLLRQLDAKITHTIGDVVLEIGSGEYFPGLAKNYGPIAVSAGFAVQSEFDQWIAAGNRPCVIRKHILRIM